MGFVFGKYVIWLKFEDGETGYFMAKEGSHVMCTKDFLNAEKYMSENRAIDFFHRSGIQYGHNSNFARVVDAKLYTDGRYFRID